MKEKIATIISMIIGREDNGVVGFHFTLDVDNIHHTIKGKTLLTLRVYLDAFNVINVLELKGKKVTVGMGDDGEIAFVKHGGGRWISIKG